MAGLVNLPTEVQELIFPHLSYQDLTHCVRVSQAWFNCFNPQLWRTLDFYGFEDFWSIHDGPFAWTATAAAVATASTYDKKEIIIKTKQALDYPRFKTWIQSDDGRGLEGLRKNGHLIWELRTEYCSVLDLIVEADVENKVRGLTDLVYFSDPYYKRPSRQRWREDCARKEFWTSFEVCPWLFDEDRQEDVEEEEGDVEERLSGPESRSGPVQSALVQLLYQNQHLKNLTLFGTVNLHQYEQNYDNTSIDPLIVSRWFEALPKSLETLSLDTP
ncbi:hypothetical protein BGX24_002009, partial [Mortierella sp. AD032]